jgi:hypothetical protein
MDRFSQFHGIGIVDTRGDKMYEAALNSTLLLDYRTTITGYIDQRDRFIAQQLKSLESVRQAMLEAKRQSEEIRKQIESFTFFVEQEESKATIAQGQAEVRQRLETIHAIGRSLLSQASGLGMAADRLPKNNGFFCLNSFADQILELAGTNGWQKAAAHSITNWKRPIENSLQSYSHHAEELRAHFARIQFSSYKFSNLGHTRSIDRDLTWANKVCREMTMEIERLRWPLPSYPLQDAFEWLRKSQLAEQRRQQIQTKAESSAQSAHESLTPLESKNVVRFKKSKISRRVFSTTRNEVLSEALVRSLKEKASFKLRLRENWLEWKTKKIAEHAALSNEEKEFEKAFFLRITITLTLCKALCDTVSGIYNFLHHLFTNPV